VFFIFILSNYLNFKGRYLKGKIVRNYVLVMDLLFSFDKLIYYHYNNYLNKI